MEAGYLAKVAQLPSLELGFVQKQPVSRDWAFVRIVNSFKLHNNPFQYYQLHFTNGKTEAQDQKSREPSLVWLSG